MSCGINIPQSFVKNALDSKERTYDFLLEVGVSSKNIKAFKLLAKQYNITGVSYAGSMCFDKEGELKTLHL